ncbi:MAG: T9SS type A sorting domain-containing protein, partial [candidate division KSB1 bacterium]|nr:T9SS type A sorting domain-containing protein [candidate division KSB1 bacterium]
VPGVAGWNSTYSGNVPLIAVNQAPRNAEMIAGVYKWAISVQPLADGSNEIRWYMVEENNKYWFGGITKDTAQVATKFNGICFGFNKDLSATQVNLYEVKVDLGKPIEIPEAPWQAFYVNQWGKTNRGTAWPILNDVNYLDGDASIGSGAPPTGWATIRGGFGDPVEATVNRAIIVSGKLEFVGGGCGDAYTHLRYALTFQDSMKLDYQYTDSAKWVPLGAAEKGHYGYEFTPRTGAGTMANGTLGVGTVWTVPGVLGWNSTYSGNVPLIAVNQAPRNAEMIAGVYKWAISVQPLADGSNEIRWYMVEENNKYWFGGITKDTAQVTTKFNGICFGFNKDLSATQVNLYEVKVDLGKPIEIPEAPWQAYYVANWGFSGGQLGGWNLTPGEFEGDVAIGGTTAPTGWSAVRGSIDPYVLSVEKDRALIVTGKMELVGGGFEDLSSLRFGLFYSDSAGTLKQDPNLDSNWVWTGTDRAHSGYLFVPPSGNNVASWSGVTGTWGGIIDGTWWDISSTKAMPFGVQLQTPTNAIAGPGFYEFAISISAQATGNLVRAKLSKIDKTYYWETSAIVPATTGKINCVAFAINNSTTTKLSLSEVKVDRGPDITTAIHDEDAPFAHVDQLPANFVLKQNYPNPFNPTTTIEFALPQSSEVDLIVYDISGRIVAELAKGRFEAGYHKVTFDAGHLASGVYIIKLKAGEFISFSKALLVK